jgi:hypothetical protein
MPRVVERGDVIEICSRLSTGQRVFFFLASLVPLLAPYELILKPEWSDSLNLFFLFAAFISAGALLVSALLLWAALAGLDTRLRFDRTRRTFSHSAGAPIVRWRTTVRPIEQIARLEVETHDWSEGAPSYSFRVLLADGREFTSGSSWSRQEIEDVVERVSAFLDLKLQA